MARFYDTREVEALSVRILRAGPRIMQYLPRAMGVTSNKVKKAAAGSVKSTHGHIPGLPAAINYDVTVGPSWVKGEIGYDRGKYQGVLGHIIEYGLGGNAPQRNLAKGLEANIDDFMTGLQRAAIDAIHGR